MIPPTLKQGAKCHDPPLPTPCDIRMLSFMIMFASWLMMGKARKGHIPKTKGWTWQLLPCPRSLILEMPPL